MLGKTMQGKTDSLNYGFHFQWHCSTVDVIVDVSILILFS